MKKTIQGLGLVFFILLAIVILIGLPGQIKGIQIDLIDDTSLLEDSKKKWSNPINNSVLVDNKAIYANDVDSHVDKLYVTVLPPLNQNSVTFEELNTHVSFEGYLNDYLDQTVEVFFEADLPGNINVSNLRANASMELRGQSARGASQKSYKIKLFDSTPEWLGFSTLNLNKHYYAALKVENKLAFDYFEMLPDFVSFRTRFVRLYIRDLSSETTNNNFKDYGLFTFIEQPNKKFLESHNLDKNGHLYKAEFFEFFRYEDAIKHTEDTTFDGNKFEKILEVRGNNDHQKLIEMLDGVNDYNQDINDVIDKHFDRDNLMTWLAVNIVFDNYDTNSRNFLLYSPLNSNKWFFLPWDYDGMQHKTASRAKWQNGLANYWGMSLFTRFFKDIENVKALGRKIEEISGIINEKNTRKLLDSYYGVVKENLLVAPDVDHLEIPINQYTQRYYDTVDLIEQNKKYFFDSLENPMPFYLGVPTLKNGKFVFQWGYSYDLQGDDLTYDFLLSKDPNFKTIVTSNNSLKTINYSVDNLKPGQYYWKVVAYDSKGNWQGAFDRYTDDNGKGINGVKKFIVEENLKVANEEEDE